MSREHDDATGDEMPLVEAARNGDFKSLSSLLQSGINVNRQTKVSSQVWRMVMKSVWNF